MNPRRSTVAWGRRALRLIWRGTSSVATAGAGDGGGLNGVFFLRYVASVTNGLTACRNTHFSVKVHFPGSSPAMGMIFRDLGGESRLMSISSSENEDNKTYGGK